jgi:hypothetical protein
MMTGERLIRGFKRAGIALAIPCFLVAAGLLAFGGYQQFERIRYEEAWKEFPVAVPEPSKEHASSEQHAKQKNIQLVPVDYDPFSDSAFQTLAIWQAPLPELELFFSLQCGCWDGSVPGLRMND